MINLLIRTAATVVALVLCAPALAGSYAIDSSESQLNFVSVKNNAVAETHRFGSVSGSIDADGSAEVFIALATVDTGIEIRDTRMRDMLFDVAKHPLAKLTATVPTDVLNALADGKSQSLDLAATLELVGSTADITLPVHATPANGSVRVTTREPVLISAETFGLDKGIAKLREVAGLDAIATAVPVTFMLNLRPAADQN